MGGWGVPLVGAEDTLGARSCNLGEMKNGNMIDTLGDGVQCSHSGCWAASAIDCPRGSCLIILETGAF